ncbi:MAG: DNA ligase [Candidatus Levybacteria bacterium RIFCSPHIGHO2_01_FULL_37_33]|nr:MAG: DNA ligase [Candidatus Levybacteria bacterium RIFCSPHIGHO2_01_FULL_37_33]OGH17447.1 MAG: DNA ligase [Candidatus Levybacteria bacterium RIFCSPHIGHO2_02_FULL_37_11]OGH29887.1 MAG: DNA ligase [Candidatus Levybacteria bacterium RIFCSPHIGHO2_12_FULL_37_12]OGH32993.1 MAG: DNA ligase [Candidatus Levybacteria bacterium RIFCSPLOWO2_01_FULL_36_54]
MHFSTLSKYYEKLEATSKRLELIDILSKLFKQAKSDEIGKICYLIQGRVAPFFEPIEMGMAENIVAVAIARAFNKEKEHVIKLYRKLGNMGIAAEELSRNHESRIRNQELTISQVFNELLKIAKFSGEGTVEKKVSALSGLLKKLDPISAKHVVNIPLGTLRLGIGDATVLDSLSLSKHGDKTLRPVLEDAYNKTSDLGFVAETFFKKGINGIKNIKLTLGKPIRPALAERLPSADEAIKRLGNEFAAEPKFDGFRVQIHLSRAHLRGVPQAQHHLGGGGEEVVQLFSRNLENTTHAFPDIVSGAKKEIKAKSAILEGEAIAYNPQTQEFLPFQETTKRRRKYKIEEMAKKLPLVLFAFDLLYLNGKDITQKPYRQRRKLLESIVSRNGGVIKIAQEKILKSTKEITEFFNEAISEGLEGLMLKKLDSPYIAGGRGFHWIKFKRTQAGQLTDSVDCVLLGVYSGKGKRTEFGVGGLLVGVYDEKKDEFVSISRIGTGLTDEEFRKVNEISKQLRVVHKPARVNSDITPSYWVEPKVVLEIQADEITRSPIHTAGRDREGLGYALRFPRLVKFREADKRAEDATTVEEIKKLYKQQFNHYKK